MLMSVQGIITVDYHLNLSSGQLRQDFTTFALLVITANHMIMNLIYIVLTASARDHIPILCAEWSWAREAYH